MTEGIRVRLLPGAVFVLIALARTCHGKPLMRWMDTAVVESTVRESIARAPSDLLLAATQDDYHSSGSGSKKAVAGAGGQHGKGYHHKASTEGNDGYRKFDAFHTKSGDKYGYEEHSSFGKKKSGKSGGKSRYNSGDKDGLGAASQVDVFKAPSQHAASPRFQSLKDVSGDAFTLDGAKYRRGLHDEEGDLFFVFSAEGNQDGQQEGDHAQQQEADDDHHDDDGEAAEQQEADDDDDYEGGGQQQRQAEDDYDY